eukprot:6205091-Pleurochrysis_carterae.AAC.1
MAAAAPRATFPEPAPRRRAPAPAPELVPSTPTIVFCIVSSAPARPERRSGKISRRESDFVEHASSGVRGKVESV